MTIAVVPGLFVAVVAAGWNELVKNFRQIALETGFEFDCADRSGAADGEDVDETGANAGLLSDGGDLVGEVVHVSVAGGGERDLVLVRHGVKPTTEGIA